MAEVQELIDRGMEARREHRSDDALRELAQAVEVSRAAGLHRRALSGRVEDWRAGLGRGVSAMPRLQPPPRRTQRADFASLHLRCPALRAHSLHVEAYGTYPAGTTFSPSRRTR